jgi:hypothetical protein
MSIEGLIIGFVLVTLALVWIILPLARASAGNSLDDALAEKRRERLLVYYERVITNLRDLDEDHATGKIGGDAYGVEREAWVQRGIQALRALDSLDSQEQSIVPATATDEAAIDHAIDDAIEQRVAAYRHK